MVFRIQWTFTAKLKIYKSLLPDVFSKSQMGNINTRHPVREPLHCLIINVKMISPKMMMHWQILEKHKALTRVCEHCQGGGGQIVRSEILPGGCVSILGAKAIMSYYRYDCLNMYWTRTIPIDVTVWKRETSGGLNLRQRPVSKWGKWGIEGEAFPMKEHTDSLFSTK